MMTAEGYRLEPELESPTPRAIRARLSAQLIRLALLIGLLGLVPFLCVEARSEQAQWTALLERGVTTSGLVVEVLPGRGGSKTRRSPAARYEYLVDGRRHRAKLLLSDDEYDAAHVGDRHDLVYLPEEPDTAVAKSRLMLNSTSSQAMGLVFLAIFAGTILGVCLIVSERRRALRRRFARHGSAVATSSLQFLKSATMLATRNTVYWTLEYTFEHQSETYSRKLTVLGKHVEDLHVDGARATVLFDPRDPRRHLPYLVVKQTYAVVKPGRETFSP